MSFDAIPEDKEQSFPCEVCNGSIVLAENGLWECKECGCLPGSQPVKKHVKCPTCAHIDCHSSTCPDNPDKFCEWVPEDEDSNWYGSQCGMSFVFEDGGAVHNGFNFCPKCGKKLKEIPWDNSEDDAE